MSTFIRKQDNFYSMTGRRFRFHPPRALPNASPRRRRWISLPPEIRLLILESIVIQSTNSDATTSDGVQGPRIAPCASVCHEWQCFFERLTFKRLALDYISLPKFAAAVKGKNIARLKYIRHLWLRVKLCNYTDQTYYKAEDGSTIARYVTIASFISLGTSVIDTTQQKQSHFHGMHHILVKDSLDMDASG